MNREILKCIISEEIKSVLKENTSKNFKIYKHPYAFDANVTFGTFEEMISNAKETKRWDGGIQVILGGSFNEKMKRKRKAAMLYIGVMYNYEDRTIYHWTSPDEMPTEEKRRYITYAKTICDSPWEGVYWKGGYFDEEMEKGLFPVSVDWGGKCYVQKGKRDANGKWNEWYEEADEFPY